MMKILPFFLLITILYSCSKEPEVISQAEYKAQYVNIYALDHNDEKIIPDKSGCRLNNDGITIFAYNKSGDYYSKFNFTINVNNTTIGIYNLGKISTGNWAVLKTRESNSTFYTEENVSGNILEVSEVDVENKRITGSFVINGFMGEFDNLKYTNELNESPLNNSFEFKTSDSDGVITNFVDVDGDYLYAYYDEGILRFKLSNRTEGVKTLYSSSVCDYYPSGSSNSYARFKNPEGSYALSKVEINNHIFTKVVINAVITSDYYNSSIELKNSTFLLY